ncbi:MAG: phosphatase PAP2 family protein [Clostridia bacterium]|nr:phosphatase PAP2 family protein [Clostridia bacterium]
MNITTLANATTWYGAWEQNFILFLQSLGGEGSFIYYLFQFITLFGEELLMIGILGTLYWGINKQRAEKIGFTLLFATVANPMIKNVFARIRPFNCPETGIQNFKDVDGFAFPSGHSSNSATIYLASAYEYREKKFKWLWAFAIIVPILVALSRSYLGAHWPTDTLAGLALGAICAFGIITLLDKVKNRHLLYLIACAICTLGCIWCRTDDYFSAMGMLWGFVFGVIFEQKYVHFENTKVWWKIVLRVLGGVVVYLGLNTIIKLAFGWAIDLDKLYAPQFAFRLVRYAIILFVACGVYPMCFAPIDKWLDSLIAKRKQQN